MDWETPPADFQYVLFERIEAERNTLRFYLISWVPSLMGRVVLRWYGRKGGAQRTLAMPFDSLERAWPFIRAQIKARLRHGYRVVAPQRYRE